MDECHLYKFCWDSDLFLAIFGFIQAATLNVPLIITTSRTLIEKKHWHNYMLITFMQHSLNEILKIIQHEYGHINYYSSRDKYYVSFKTWWRFVGNEIERFSKYFKIADRILWIWQHNLNMVLQCVSMY